MAGIPEGSLVLLLTLLGVFVATVSLTVGGYLLVNRRRLATAEAARARLGDPLALIRPQATILRDTSASELRFLDRLLSGRSVTARVAEALEAAGMEVKPGNFFLVSGIAAVAFALAGSMAFGSALPFAFIGAIAPWLWVRHSAKRRLLRFNDQLPDTLDMLVGAMRAGYSFHTAMKFIGEEMPAPIGPEFARFYDEQRLGMDAREALFALQRRVASTDLRLFVTAVLIQRETGGNLTEVLGNIADVMRQRADVQRQVETLTAESKLSARVLALLPVIAFFGMLMLDPVFMRPMLDQALGRAMLAYAAFSIVAGYALLVRIAAVDV
jgi:tight adherence protein B